MFKTPFTRAFRAWPGIALLLVGIVFSQSARGEPSFELLHGFVGQTWPTSALIKAADGNFYGTTFGWGYPTFGTVFRITPKGKLTTLHSFAETDASGASATLIEASDGTVYGTTRDGGAADLGMVFRITASSEFTTLHSFSGPDGTGPSALIEASDGRFYGTTRDGGATNNGTVFKITPSGELTTLHSFSEADGSFPLAAPVEGTDGTFYGTTSGDLNPGSSPGTVFKFTASGELTTLHSFGRGPVSPSAALIEATDGNFYGTTSTGGTDNDGTVFRITPSGELTTLHSFTGNDGSNPAAALIEASDGSFYGTTSYGGPGGGGIVFRVRPTRNADSFLRGDCNGEGSPCSSVNDALELLNWLFLGRAEPPCLAACDADGSGELELADAVYGLNFCFEGTAVPVAPFPECGVGTETDVALGCEASACE